MIRRPPRSPLFPSTPLFRSRRVGWKYDARRAVAATEVDGPTVLGNRVPLIILGGDRHGEGLSGRHGRGGLTVARSEEHTSELQSRSDLVCRLLLEKKKKKIEILMLSDNSMIRHPYSVAQGVEAKSTNTNEHGHAALIWTVNAAIQNARVNEHIAQQ